MSVRAGATVNGGGATQEMLDRVILAFPCPIYGEGAVVDLLAWRMPSDSSRLRWRRSEKKGRGGVLLEWPRGKGETITERVEKTAAEPSFPHGMEARLKVHFSSGRRIGRLAAYFRQETDPYARVLAFVENGCFFLGTPHRRQHQYWGECSRVRSRTSTRHDRYGQRQ